MGGQTRDKHGLLGLALHYRRNQCGFGSVEVSSPQSCEGTLWNPQCGLRARVSAHGFTSC